MSRGSIELQDSVAVVTGAASGIGRALALQLAESGAKLALSDIAEAELEATRVACVERAKDSSRVHIAKLDVSVREDVYAYADAVAEHFGAVNLVINNAGVTIKGTVAELSIEDIEWLMGINFWGVVYGTKAFLPHLGRAQWGHIINLSSIFGIVAIPSQAAYHAAKFAVRGFTESLRQDLEKDGGRVSASCVHPGGVKTNIVRDMRTAGDTELSDASRSKAVRRFEKGARTTPEQAARIIIDGLLKDERRILVGTDAKLMDALQRMSPNRYPDAMRKLPF